MADESAPGPASRLLQSVTRLGGTLLGVVETRVDLLTTEVSEDAARGMQILLWAVLAMLAGFGGLLFSGIAVIAYFWDTHRVGAAVSVTALFLATTALAALVSRSKLRAKPRLLDATRTVLAQDVAALRGHQ